MKIVDSIEEMQTITNTYCNQTIGFVPTMGFLHEGHLSLAKRARAENDIVVMSIFVNPLQFGENEDFDDYPRDAEMDMRLAKEVGVDYLFFPTKEEMYPSKLSMEMKMVEGVNILCGASRPGHFDGVITVVSKLFHIVQPSIAYFGLKDAQQAAVIHALVKDLNFPVQIKALATIREVDGLAKSSRNKYLSQKEREAASSLVKALTLGQQLLRNKSANFHEIRDKVQVFLQETSEGIVDYVELLEYPTLQAASASSEQLIIAVAVKYSKARLIDNYILDNSFNRLDELSF